MVTDERDLTQGFKQVSGMTKGPLTHRTLGGGRDVAKRNVCHKVCVKFKYAENKHASDGAKK